MFGNIKRKQNPSADGRESVKLFGCQNSQYTKVNVCSFHYLKKWIVAVTILSSFSVDCWCFGKRLSPVFWAMSPVSSTPWKVSLFNTIL